LQAKLCEDVSESRALDHAIEAAGSGVVDVQVGNSFSCEEVSNRLF